MASSLNMAHWPPSLRPFHLSKHLTVKGYILFEITFDTEQLQAAKQYVLKRIGEGVFKPRIAKTFPLAEIVEAHRYMEANTHIGKIVVTV